MAPLLPLRSTLIAATLLLASLHASSAEPSLQTEAARGGFLAARRAAAEAVQDAAGQNTTWSFEQAAANSEPTSFGMSDKCAQVNLSTICSDVAKHAFHFNEHCSEPPCLTENEAIECCKEHIKDAIDEMPQGEKVAIVVGIVAVICCLCCVISCICRVCCCRRK
mmetsp:Transcript_22364/g.48957  ORF Transcript_22364/g.48957 Transcript_22364/m.48957 type:complete len:165 (+) Transcript_22364:1014-1508(+)